MSTYVKQDITQQCKSLPALACQPFWISEGLGPSLHADRSQSHRMMQKPAGDLGNPSGFAQRSSAKDVEKHVELTVVKGIKMNRIWS